MRVIHVLRKPLSEGTVAANVLEHGTGAINVDASRVGSEVIHTHSRGANQAFPKRPGETSPEDSGRQKRQDIFDRRPRKGRWPGNLILQHDDGCRCVGSKRVKGSNPSTPGGGSADKVYGLANDIYGPYRNKPVADFTGADGMEEAATWECAPGCPAAALDEQSIAGGMHGAGRARSKVVEGDVDATSINMGGARDMFRMGDKGGASRFFKQVGGQKP